MSTYISTLQYKTNSMPLYNKKGEYFYSPKNDFKIFNKKGV